MALTNLKRTGIIFIIGSLTHIILMQLYFGFLDWVLVWEAADHISKGNSLYDGQFPGTLVEGRLHGAPRQMPFFIYSLSIFAKIGNERLGRLYLSTIFILLGYVIYLIIQQNKYRDSILLIYFFNPISILISYYGMFDHLPLLFSISSVYFLSKSKYYVSGLLLGMGVITKLFPLYIGYILGLYILKTDGVKKSFQFGASVWAVIIPVMFYFGLNYPQGFIDNAIIWQLERTELSLSLWANVLSAPQHEYYSFIRQIVLVLIPIGVVYSIRGSHDSTINYKLAFIGITTLLITNNILLPHYILWMLIFLLPIGNDPRLIGDLTPFTTKSVFDIRFLTSMFFLFFQIPSYFWGKNLNDANITRIVSIVEFLGLLLVFVYGLIIIYTPTVIPIENKQTTITPGD